MAKINLPSEIIKKEIYKSLPAKEKDEYITNLLKKILELNPAGVTISQIKESCELTYSTIWHHLEILSCTAQAKKTSRGNLDIYFPMGDQTHLDDYSKDDSSYSLSIIQNMDSKLLCIQEKNENRQGNQAVTRGVTLPFELANKIAEILKKAK